MFALLSLRQPRTTLRTRLLGTSALVLATATILAGAQAARADTVFYDNDVPGGAIGTVDGVWNIVDNDWNTADDGSGSATAFSNIPGDDAVFGGTGVNVDVQLPVGPRSITFTVTGYNIRSAAGVPNPRIVAKDGQGMMNPAGLTIDVVNMGDTAEISTSISTAGQTDRPITVNGAGAGTLVLSGDNTDAISLLDLQAGQLDNEGNYGGPVEVNGGTMRAISGEIADVVTVDGGTLLLQGGTFSESGGTGQIVLTTGGVTVQHGSDIATDASRTVDVDVDGGTLTVDNGSTLTGTITQTAGNVANNGTYVGTAGVEGGIFTNAGNVTGTINVTDAGQLIVNSGTITGNVTNTDTGQVTLNGGIITAGVQNNMGTTTVTGTVSSNITNGTVATTGTLNIGPAAVLTGVVTNQDGTTTNNGTITGTVIVNDGTFDANGGSSVSGIVTNNGGDINTLGGVFTTGILNNSGTVDVTVNTSAPVTNAGGTVTVANGITLTGAYASTNGTTNNSGTIADPVTLSGGTINNLGTGIIGSTVVVSNTGSLVNQAGGTVTGLVTLNGGAVTDNGGTFTAGILNNSGTVNLLVAATSTVVTNEGGTVNVGGATTWTHNYTSNRGATVNAGTINGTISISGSGADAVTDQFDNNGDLIGNVSVDGTGILNANGGSTLQGVLTLNGGTVNAAGGTFTQEIVNDGGNLNIAAATSIDVRNQDGLLTIQNGQTLTGTVTNVGGDMNNNAGTLNGALTINGGDVINSGNINSTVDLTTGTFNTNGGTILGQATVIGGQMNSAGTTFSGGLRGQGGTIIVDGNTNAALTNVGSTVTVNGGQTLTGNLLNTSGTVANNGTLAGTVTVNGGEVASSGIITQGVTVNAGGDFRTTGGTLQADVINQGGDVFANGGTYQAQLRTDSGITRVGGAITVTNVENAGGTLNILTAGTVTGNVTHSSGTSTQNGRVTGNVSVISGTYNAQGLVNQNMTNTGGSIVANTAMIDGTLTNTTGDVTVAGTSRGTLTNADSLVINAAGRWTGSVTQTAGIATNAGVVTEDVILQGGNWTQQTGSNTAGQTRLGAGATLVADGGSFTGGIIANGGTLSITGDMTGDLRNNGINITIGAAQTVTGDVTNADGNLTVNGRITGSLTVSGGVVRSNVISRVNGGTVVNGTGQLDMNGGVYTDDVVVAAGDVNVLADTQADLRNTGGRIAVNAGVVLNGGVTQTAGFTGNAGQISQDVTVSGGALTNIGTLNGALTVAGSGTVNHNAGNFRSSVSVSGGNLNLNGGGFTNTIENTGGTINVNTDTTASVINRSGDLFVDSGQTLDGNVNNQVNGYVRLDGVIEGDLVNGGLVDYFGDINGTIVNAGTINTATADARAKIAARSSSQAFTLSGPVSNVVAIDNLETGTIELDGRSFTAGRIDNAGLISVSNGNVLASRGVAAFAAPGTLTVSNGTVAGDIRFAAGSTVDLTNATLEGDVTSGTVISSAGTTRVTPGAFPGSTAPIGSGNITFTGAGGVDVDRGLFAITGDLTTSDSSVLTVANDATLQAANLTSNGTLTLGTNATLRTSGRAANTGTATFGNGTEVFGRFVNTGVINGSGRLRFADGLTGGGRVNMGGNASTADRVVLDGDLGSQAFNIDIDLSDNVGRSDRIVMSSGAFVTGDVTLNFNVLGVGGEQEDDIVVLDAAAGQGAISVAGNGLPDSSNLALTDGILIYGLTQNSAGDLVVFDALDQGISSIAGTIVLAQSLVGSVINRPSSPFVSGLAFEDENPCGAGIWARAIGGAADATGEINQINGTTEPFDSSISADYYGVQLGGDYACFNGFYDGWDLAFGAIGGVNIGKSNQPIFAPDPSQSTGLSDFQTSVTDVDFTQAYGGVYVAAVRDRLAVDLQYRIERTDYTATNLEAEGGASLGLNDETFSSDGRTLSGAVSYSMPVKDTGLTFVPTLGFAYSQVSTDPIHFEGRGVVQIDDFDSQIGFAGGTLTRTKVGSDGVSALTQFGTVTVYNDFAENPTSTFTRSDNGDETRISSENLGTYGEISAGLNYVKILQPGELGAVKQFNASVRADVRVSDRLESWGVTAQARFQF